MNDISADNGLPGPIGETFAIFEPRFYGISLQVETPALFEAWTALSGLFGKRAMPQLPRFEATCLQTALVHELRHFHDALISPFANTILMLRLAAAFDGLKLFSRGSKAGANCLPLPLKTWMAMSEAERAGWLATVSADPPSDLAAPPRPLPLPCLNGGQWAGNWAGQSAIDAYAETASLVRGPLAVLHDNPIFRAQPEAARRVIEAIWAPRNLFEASALAVQLQAAWTDFGEEAAAALGEHLLTSDHDGAAAFRRLSQRAAPAGRPGLIDPIRVSAVATWCLLGNPRDGDDFDPAARFMRLLPLLESDGGIAEPSPVAVLWDDWDARLGLKGWRRAMREMRDRTARALQSYGALSQRAGDGTASTFVAVLEAYVRDQKRMTDFLLADPDAYVNTRRYLEAARVTLPQPLLSVQLPTDVVAPMKTLPRTRAVRLPLLSRAEGARGWNRMVVDLQNPPRPRLLDAALELELLCRMCDVSFSDEAPSGPDSEAILQSIARASGMVPLFVF